MLAGLLTVAGSLAAQGSTPPALSIVGPGAAASSPTYAPGPP
jgi:hypothetical protein